MQGLEMEVLTERGVERRPVARIENQGPRQFQIPELRHGEVMVEMSDGRIRITKARGQR